MKNSNTTLLKDNQLNFGYINPNEYDMVLKVEEKYPEMTSEFKSLCKEQYLMFIKKQLDYGPNNIALGTKLENEEEKKMSISGIVIRLNDKINRLINLVLRSTSPKNESIEDSFMDSSIYSKIACIVMRGKWGK